MSGRPISHVAKDMGISRTCAHRWISRYRAEGWDGLQDGSSRPKSCPHATPVKVIADVLAQRVEHREGPTDLALRCGTSARTVSRILARGGMPRLWDLDPVTGARIQASRASDRRYERDAPGDVIHIDVKKRGRIPEGGGWGADPSQSRPTTAPRAETCASSTSTSPSTTTPASPTPKSCPMRKGQLAQDSSPERLQPWQPKVVNGHHVLLTVHRSNAS
jgi:hypothetical protein